MPRWRSQKHRQRHGRVADHLRGHRRPRLHRQDGNKLLLDPRPRQEQQQGGAHNQHQAHGTRARQSQLLRVLGALRLLRLATGEANQVQTIAGIQSQQLRVEIGGQRAHTPQTAIAAVAIEGTEGHAGGDEIVVHETIVVVEATKTVVDRVINQVDMDSSRVGTIHETTSTAGETRVAVATTKAETAAGVATSKTKETIRTSEATTKTEAGTAK
jgi:hypothetical protein